MVVFNRKKFLLKARFIFTVFLLTSTSVFSQDLAITSHVDRTNVGVNQQFELNIELSGSDANKAPQPQPPALDFAKYVGSSTSTSMQFVNGNMSVNVTYLYHYIATAEGKFTIPAIEYEFKGKKLTTEPISFQVVKSQSSTQPQGAPSSPRQASPGAQNIEDLLFLKAEVDKKRVYQNEPVIVSYKIYFALQVTNYGIPQLPNMVGFWTEDFELPNRPKVTTEVVDGRQFRVAEIKRVALFPQGPGKKQLDVLVVDCEVQVPRKRSRRNAFDSLFDDPFFNFNQTVRKTIASNPVSIDVLTLPENGKPKNFLGAVGNFSITGVADKRTTKTNEAVTFNVEINGRGNLKILSEPSINFPSDFETYDPKVSENINRSGNVVSGAKKFEYVLIPRFPGTQTIPQVIFSFFDPTTKSYRTVSTNPIDITVTKGEQQFSGLGVGTSKEDVKFIGQDIRFIQMRLPEFRKIGVAFYKKAWFYLVLTAPFVVLLATVFYQRHQEKLSSNLAYARRRQANQMALKRLKKARKHLLKGETKQFYAEISTSLMGFIGDKFNVAAAGLITDEVEKVLHDRGIEEQAVQAYLGCLQTCDFQRFAPSNSNNNDMQAFFDQAKDAIIQLEKQL